jgi:hypothetical protein
MSAASGAIICTASRAARAVGLGGQARFSPDVLRREVLRAHQPLRGRSAAVVGVALGVPVAAHFGVQARLHNRVFQVFGQQRVAAHLAVVVHAKFRVFGGKAAPVAALAQQQQPVVAQPVFLVAAGVARQKVLHFLRAGFSQARLELPVGGPGLQRVASGLRQQLRQAGLVAALEGIVHVHDQAVAGGVGARLQGRRCRAGHQAS